MKRFAIILMALALGLSVSAQRGRYSKGRKPVRTTHRVAPRPVTTIKTCPDNNHPHAIDLGLPSGTKWACCNVGASKPTAYGGYYAWGETTTKSNYDWSTYKWCSDWDQLTKYCNDSEYGLNGFTDNKTTLDLSDDAAYVNWGVQWRMPEGEECDELIDHTTNKWVKNFNGTGVNGYLFTGKNGKRIFLPAAGPTEGTRDGFFDYGVRGVKGEYWSSSLDTEFPYNAQHLYFLAGYVQLCIDNDSYGSERNMGRSVRPVYNADITIKTCPDDNHPHAIDLGLPSGTKWACCNVGATKPEKYGSYFAWGETSPKNNYDADTYKWYKKVWVKNEYHDEGGYDADKITKYCTDSEEGYNGFTDNKTTLDLADDAARANWGDEWCMPDSADFGELIEHTNHRWVKKYNGTDVTGRLFIGKNGKCIFLPAASWGYDASLNAGGSLGNYQSSSLITDSPHYAYYLDFGSGYVEVDLYRIRGGRCGGSTVRPVRSKN